MGDQSDHSRLFFPTIDRANAKAVAAYMAELAQEVQTRRNSRVTLFLAVIPLICGPYKRSMNS